MLAIWVHCDALAFWLGIALYCGMAHPSSIRLLEVTVTLQQQSLWKWDISEANLEIAYGYAPTREIAQFEGDSALFAMLTVVLK
jgi:hypothetical protein